MSSRPLVLALPFLASMAVACSEPLEVHSIEAPSSHSSSTADRASNDCEVILRNILVEEDGLAVTFDVATPLTEEPNFEARIGFLDASEQWAALDAELTSSSDQYESYFSLLPHGLNAVELIPYIRFDESTHTARLWDHNLRPDNYPLNGEDLRIDSATCSDRARIVFSDDWSETVHGELRAGSDFTLDYSAQRLPECRGRKYGSPVWSIIAYVQFDDQAPTPVVLTVRDPATNNNIVTRPTINIPETATRMSLWFYNSSLWSCYRYDSNYSHNYQFMLR